MNTWHPRSHLHILWHPKAAPDLGESLANRLAQCIGPDLDQPFKRGIGIPVFLHDSPPAIDWDQAKQTMLVVLIESEMLFDADWHEPVRALFSEAGEQGNEGHHMLPFGLAPGAHNLLAAQGDALTRYVTVADADERSQRVSRALVQELCRHLGNEPAQPGRSPRPQKLFISHTKRSARSKMLAETLKTVTDNVPGERFFDTVSIAPGYSLTDEIKDGLRDSAVVVLRTDDYAASPWCQLEVIESKRLGRPMVIVDLLSDREPRFFPELANIPSARLKMPPPDAHGNIDPAALQANMERCLDRVMEEVLAYTYALESLKYLQSQGAIPSDADLRARPPEDGDLLDAVRALYLQFQHDVGADAELQVCPPQVGDAAAAPADEQVLLSLVYPEPPVADLEAVARNRIGQIVIAGGSVSGTASATPRRRVCRLDIATPLTLHRDSLAGKVIGISISGGEVKPPARPGDQVLRDPSWHDLRRRGMSPESLEQLLFEFSRHAIAHGATIAYGGDLRDNGFTQRLFDFLHLRKAAGVAEFHKARNYLAWPIHLNMDKTWWANHMDVADLRRVPPPEDLIAAGLDPTRGIPPSTPENRYIWSRCLSRMRADMTADLHARIIACGKWQGYVGCMPGLLEEALVALDQSKPLYLLGGFGGTAAALALALAGDDERLRARLMLPGDEPDRLGEAHQRTDAAYAAALDYYRQQSAPDMTEVDYAGATERLASVGLAGLNNGLETEENAILLTTNDIHQAMGLVFEGLRRLFPAA